MALVLLPGGFLGGGRSRQPWLHQQVRLDAQSDRNPGDGLYLPSSAGVGVGWQRRCKIRLSPLELDHQDTAFFLSPVFGFRR